MSTTEKPSTEAPKTHILKIIGWLIALVVAIITGSWLGRYVAHQLIPPVLSAILFGIAMVVLGILATSSRLKLKKDLRIFCFLLAVFAFMALLLSWDEHDNQIERAEDATALREYNEWQRQEAADKTRRQKRSQELVANTEGTFGGSVTILSVDPVKRTVVFTIFGRSDECRYKAEIRRTPSGDRIVKGTERELWTKVIVEEDDAFVVTCAEPPFLQGMEGYGPDYQDSLDDN